VYLAVVPAGSGLEGAVLEGGLTVVVVGGGGGVDEGETVVVVVGAVVEEVVDVELVGVVESVGLVGVDVVEDVGVDEGGVVLVVLVLVGGLVVGSVVGGSGVEAFVALVGSVGVLVCWSGGGWSWEAAGGPSAIQNVTSTSADAKAMPGTALRVRVCG
jgi:hypothetical protein